MDDRAGHLQISERRVGLFATRSAIYILVLLSAFLASYLYRLRAENIFVCQANGYTTDRYLGYCEGADYGDYEHGAFWFDLEPAAEMSAANADLLFVGSSRLQIAFSTVATAEWLSSASARYYLLGFLGYENSIFTRALLQKLKPRAEIYVINIEDFFERSEAPIAKVIMHDSAARVRYKIKRLLQFVHKPLCVKLPAICGRAYAIFRSRQTGAYYRQGMDNFKGHDRPISYDLQLDEYRVDNAVAVGQVFLSELHVRPDCVILTAVPTFGTKLSVEKAIANGLGKTLVVPERLDGLQTFDGSHLDVPSAERWSKAFFDTAGPQIQKCLRGHTSQW